MSEKTAFVLSGGGAKGCFQVGAIQALDRVGIRPDVLYGTSVGALNATGYAYGGIEELTNIWNSIKNRGDILSLDTLGLITGQAQGLYKMKPIRKKIKKMLKGKSPSTEAWVCSVDLKDGSLTYTQAGSENYAEQVEASAAMPVAMHPVNNRYVDGGVREQTPLKKAIDDGADRIFAILCNPVDHPLEPFKMPKWPYPIIKVALRCIDIMEHEVFFNDIRRCREHNDLINQGNGQEGRKKIDLHVIAPPHLVIDTLEFNQPKIQRGIMQGYYHTRNNYPYGDINGSSSSH